MIATLLVIGIAVVIFVGAIVLVVVGMKDLHEKDPLQQRLADFAARGEVASLEQIELSQPLTERVIYPSARKIGEIVTKFTPQNALQTTAHRLELAGNPRWIRASHLLGAPDHAGGWNWRFPALYLWDW